MKNFQFYKHFKLPITINPLNYGKLIFNQNNIYISSITPRTLTLITQNKDFNDIKFYRDGDLIFTYKDHIISDNLFIRTLNNYKFTFENNILINIEKTIILLILLFILIFQENYYDLLIVGVGLSRNI
jgi:hypothetical protein